MRPPANRPIVVDSEDFIGMGATGGFVMSAENVGRAAGQRAARILSGEAAANIPVVTTNFNTPEFDARKLPQKQPLINPKAVNAPLAGRPVLPLQQPAGSLKVNCRARFS